MSRLAEAFTQSVPPATSSALRQLWLENVVSSLRDRFKAASYEVPSSVRVSVGWPRGSHGKGRAIGQCWALEASSDKHNEIFVSPELGEHAASIRVMGVLAHELVHATVGVDAGHKRPFKQCAEAVGLTGKMTSTEEGPAFAAWGDLLVKRIGPYPAGMLSLTARKKQSTRLVKCGCDACGYVARVTRKWIDDVGAPHCPLHGEMDAAS